MVTKIDRKKLVDAWIKLHHTSTNTQEYNNNFWAFNALSDLCDENPSLSFDIIDDIRKLDGSDIILANLAAGPLEDLLVKHGDLLIDRVEEKAKMDKQFQKLLGAVWKNEIKECIWKRIREVCGPSF